MGQGNSNHRRTVINPAHQKYCWASLNDSWVGTCQLKLARMASFKTDFLCTLIVLLIQYQPDLGFWAVWNDSIINAVNCSELSNQGAKKIIFTACHSGKLKLAFTSPDVISTSPKSFLTSRIDFTVLLLF